jgi:hypothetical protein
MAARFAGARFTGARFTGLCNDVTALHPSAPAQLRFRTPEAAEGFRDGVDPKAEQIRAARGFERS